MKTFPYNVRLGKLPERIENYSSKEEYFQNSSTRTVESLTSSSRTSNEILFFEIDLEKIACLTFII